MNDQQEQVQIARPRVLFADRSGLMRKAAQRILGESFHVVLAQSEEQAWVCLLDDPLIQVLFFDLSEQQVDRGLDLLDRIRNCDNRRVKDTPVVVITDDEASEEQREQALKSGATDFIDKPFRPSELLARASAHATTGDAVQRLRLLQRRHNKDSDTGLGNRRYFFERMAQAISFARRQQQPLTMVHVHLDGLDRAQHRLDLNTRQMRLRELGRILARAVRHEDTVYRTGPETFSFILPGTNETGAEAVRCRLVPELDGLGMLQGTDEHRIVSRFIVQAPEITEQEPLVDCLRRIREGMGTMLIAPDEPVTAPPHKASEDLDTLLEMARDGDLEHLREQLPDLLDKLKPLLELANQFKTRAPNAPSGEDD